MTQEIITITVEAGQMTARRKSRKIAQRRPVPVWAIVKYAALTIAGIMLFREGAARALAYRGYFAVGGEVFALLLPIFYYCLPYATTYLNPRFQKPLSGTTTHRRAGAEHMTGYTALKNSCGPTTSHARRTPSGSGGPRDCRRPARRKCGTIRTAGF